MSAAGAPLRVAIAGFGRVAERIHAATIARHPGAEVVAVSDPDPARRARAGELLPGARVVATTDALLAAGDAEAVVVCVPGPAQAETAVAAFAARMHVYVEKPIATALADAQAVVGAWRHAGTVGMAGLNYRLHPHYARAQEVVASGRLGDLIAARAVFSAPASLDQADWKRSRARGGGVLLDLGSHHADLVHALFGRRVAEVRARPAAGETVLLELRLDDGMPVQSLLSLDAGDDERTEVYGSAARLTVDRTRALDVRVTPQVRPGTGARALRALAGVRRAGFAVTRARAVGFEPSYAIAMDRFIGAVRSGGRSAPTVLDGLHSLEVVLAAEASLDSGAPVRLPAPAGAPA